MKYKDLSCLTISYIIEDHKIEHTLLNLSVNVNLLSYSIYRQLNLKELKLTSITLLLIDKLINVLKRIIEDELVQIDNFTYPVDFIVF